MRKAWAWVRWFFSLRRMERDMRMLRYQGQPLYWHPKVGLYVKPRTSLRTRRPGK